MNVITILCLLSQTPVITYDKPKLYNLSPIRVATHESSIIKELESHMPPNHVYRDNNLQTWAHETTHGLNAEIALRFRMYDKRCYYVFNNQYVILPKCQLSLQGIKYKIPPDILQDTRHLNFYFNNNTWDNAEYVLEEWNAYIAGSMLCNEMKIAEDHEILCMLEFNMYALHVALYENNPDILSFIKYNTVRTRSIFLESNSAKGKQFWDRFLQHRMYANLRTSIKTKFGNDFCNAYLGIE